MCQRLALLQTQCLAEAYLIQPVGANAFSCTPNGPAPPPPNLSVVAHNLQGLHFRIIANSTYISSEFVEGGGPITFQSSNNQPVVAPQFRQLTTMSLVSVTPGSTVDVLGQIQNTQVISSSTLSALTQSPTQGGMQFRIMVNGTSLVASEPWLAIAAPSDANVLTEVRVDPLSILSMGATPNCTVTLQQINQLRQASQAAASTGTDSSMGN